MRKTGIAGIVTLVTLLAGAAGNFLFANEKPEIVKAVKADVVVLEPGDHVPASAIAVKSIEVGGGNGDACSYFEVIEAAKQMAISVEANVIKINKHISRPGRSGCDKLVATLYKAENIRPLEKEISWNKNRKLTWDDFRGAIPHDAEEQAAAATFCGIGFETNTISTAKSNLKIHVYNTFYTNNSWAKPGDMNNEVLAHEQGHFDLCELYTRKLRERLSNVRVNVNTLKTTLSNIYEDVQAEYRSRQEAYENETAHGVNLPQQKQWQELLEKELTETEKWLES